jgi:hypothetical protein
MNDFEENFHKQQKVYSLSRDADAKKSIVDYCKRARRLNEKCSPDLQKGVPQRFLSGLPIFGWPECLYTDNGSHFANAEVKTLFESHGSEVTYAPISHPESVRLAERMAMLISSQLRKWVIDKIPAHKQY